MRTRVYTCWMNSGLRNEKPMNSVWSRFIMNSLSVGVRSVFSPVNCLSKLLTSLRCFCTHANTHAHARNKHTKHYILARFLCDVIVMQYILSTSKTYDFRFERRLHFAVFDSRPIDTPEKHVSPDVFFASGTFTQSLHRVFRQKLQFKETKKKKNKSLRTTCVHVPHTYRLSTLVHNSQSRKYITA